MGCFCRLSVAAMRGDTAAEPADDTPDSDEERPADKVVSAIGQWLATRWLPAAPWEPDPEWQDVELPEPPMQPAALSVLSGLIQAQQACQSDLAIDPAQPEQLGRLVRIVVTLNRRLDDLQQVAEDDAAPWDDVAALNDQADAVRDALSQGLLSPPEDTGPDQPIGPWRPLLTKVKALAPLISVFRMLDLDPADADAAELLSDRVRRLRAVTLPPLEAPSTVYRLIARYNAIGRLQRSLGADPRKVPFARVQRAVHRKVDAVVTQLPAEVRLVEDRLTGMAQRQPNPSNLLTNSVIAQAQAINPALLQRLRWKVPEFDQLDMLTTAAPVVTLVTLLRTLGTDPIRTSPCSRSCDAGAARGGQAATGSPDSGTGAAPAG